MSDNNTEPPPSPHGFQLKKPTCISVPSLYNNSKPKEIPQVFMLHIQDCLFSFIAASYSTPL